VVAAAQLRPVGDSETWRVRMVGARLPPACAHTAGGGAVVRSAVPVGFNWDWNKLLCSRCVNA
jgi:hypothetical protein